MGRRLSSVRLCWIVLLAVTATAEAQDHASLTFKSGERIVGQLVDMGGIGFTFRVGAAERQVALDDVAVIDFTDRLITDAEWSKLTDEPQIVLRNGETIKGELYDVSGSTPLKLTINTPEGQRELFSSEVARIVLARPPAPLPVGTTGRPACPRPPCLPR